MAFIDNLCFVFIFVTELGSVSNNEVEMGYVVGDRPRFSRAYSKATAGRVNQLWNGLFACKDVDFVVCKRYVDLNSF